MLNPKFQIFSISASYIYFINFLIVQIIIVFINLNSMFTIINHSILFISLFNCFLLVLIEILIVDFLANI